MWGVEPVRLAWPEEDIPPEPTAIRAADVRVPLGELLDAWSTAHLGLAKATLDLWSDEPGQGSRTEAYVASVTPKRQGGRPRPAPTFYRRCAALNEQAKRRGNRAPNKAVLAAVSDEYMEHHDVPPTLSTVRGWVRKGRKLLEEEAE